MFRQRWRVLVSSLTVFAIALTARVHSYSYVTPVAAAELESGYCNATNQGSFCGYEYYCKVSGLLICLDVDIRSIYNPASPPLCPMNGPTPCSDDGTGGGAAGGGGSDGGTGSNCNLGWCEEIDHAI